MKNKQTRINDICTIDDNYQRSDVDYITTSNVQYIDTGIYPDVNVQYNCTRPSVTLRTRAWHYNVEMIPCVEKATGKLGFWDTVDNRFWEVNEFFNSFTKDAKITVNFNN